MAALVVQSRFAGLKIEDDEFPSPNNSNQKNKKVKPSSVKKSDPPKKIKSANGNKSQIAPKKKKAKQGSATSAQWEQWKQKDEEFVDGNFETEMQQAIMLSKLDYEENEDIYKQSKKDTAYIKKELASRPNTKKQKKKNVMTLDQFNSMVSSGEEVRANNNYDDKPSSSGSPKTPEADTEFFERIKDDTKSELIKDKIIERIKNRLTAPDEVITRVQYADTLEKKDLEITALKEEILNLKQELLKVKVRNKKLCNILGQGEMRDKAEVLIEVERLRAVQDELNEELASLHTDLEKERSKNADPRTKDKKKKLGLAEKEVEKSQDVK